MRQRNQTKALAKEKVMVIRQKIDNLIDIIYSPLDIPVMKILLANKLSGFRFTYAVIKSGFLICKPPMDRQLLRKPISSWIPRSVILSMIQNNYIHVESSYIQIRAIMWRHYGRADIILPRFSSRLQK